MPPEPPPELPELAAMRRHGLWRARAVAAFVVLGLGVLLLWRSSIVLVMPGEIGVRYSPIGGGTEVNHVYGQGLGLKLPWDRVFMLAGRGPTTFVVSAYSRDSMPIEVEALLLYQTNPKAAPRIVLEMGTNFVNDFIVPLAEGAIRAGIGTFSSHELYTIEYPKLYATLMEHFRAAQRPYAGYFDSLELTFRKVRLPPEVVAAITRKLAVEQDTDAYRFKLSRERLEAERLRIQAGGLRAFYEILQNAMTDKLLTWRGIEATVQLARSPNSKIVIVGGGKNQMPLILGGDLAPVAAAPATDAPTASLNGDPLSPDWQAMSSPLDAAPLPAATTPPPADGPPAAANPPPANPSTASPAQAAAP